MTTPILIRNWLSLGDAVVLTAFVRDLSLAFPRQYKVTVNTPYSDLWRDNPYIDSHIVSREEPKNKGKVYTLPYGEYIPKHSEDFNHFIGAYHKSFKKQTGLFVPLTAAKPDLRTVKQVTVPRPAERYWVVVGGAKSDFQVKQWNRGSYQAVVNYLVGSGIPVVQIGKNGGPQNGKHPPLKGAISLVDKTNVREMMQIIAWADGVISPVTAAMHIAAGFDKPGVVIAGGAEEWWWEGYHADNPALANAQIKPQISHRYLHTLGLLSCCKKKGCWKTKVYDGREASMCLRKIDIDSQVLPQCMAMISPEQVYSSVLSYYLDGTLPEIPGMKLPSADQPIQFVKDGRTMVVRVDQLSETGKTQPAIKLDPSKMLSLPTLLVPEAVAAIPPVPPPPGKRMTGERLTICSVFYGKAYELHERWLKAVRKSPFRGQFDVRIFCNDVSERTAELLREAVAEGLVRYVYDAGRANAGKYPGMRALFHDPLRPIETEWVLWLDDDTFLDANVGWFVGAMEFIRHHQNISGFGALYSHPKVNRQAEDWIRKAGWYRHKPIPAGGIKFMSGSCWFIRKSAIETADIPDARLRNNGGDITIGEQLRQHNLSIAGWNQDKTVIAWSMTPRRGISEPGPYNLHQ